MKPVLLDIDKWAEGLKEVTVHKFDDSGKLTPEGLFSQQIFGPTRSFHCACRRSSYRGRNSGESVCKICGVDITSSNERRRRFAKIVLPFEILNPLFYFMVVNAKLSCKKHLDNMLFYRCKYYFDKEGKLTKINEDTEVPPNTEILEGLDGAISLIENLIEKENKKQFKYIGQYMGQLKVKNIIVIPPGFRNYIKGYNGKSISDTINQLYQFLIRRSNHVKNIPMTITKDSEIFKANFKQIQKTSLEIYDHIMDKLSKKKGLIRSHILGKRVDFSGRSVISPEPTLKLNECRIPYLMALEIYKPQLSVYMINKKIFKRYNQAIAKIEDSIENKDPDLFNTVKEFCKGKIGIINRQPTLHRVSMLAFNIDVHLGNTIQIHPMICHPLNGDFDGDAIAFYIPTTPESIEDTKTKIGIWNNLISPADFNIVPWPNQDIILGLYESTK